ncbi:antitoxin [Caulobacter endophyticus]|uniref:Antitoxin n=1 Tax=Caulobacter endophyticus TaxID=2172652 RepID=A0A2T9K7N6_9CAUL|nr:antitoxin [Caulobacter endophyticus]PVM91801.1 antitoxin [Caulobacter endophyticus]
MADGFDIHIDEEQAARLQAVADMLGLSAADYAISLIEAGLEDLPPKTIDPDPAIDRAILAKAKASGGTIPWSQVRDRLRARHR